MASTDVSADVHVEVGDDHVALVEIRRPPNNFFDFDLVMALANAFERLDEDPACRAILLASEGKHFCAGANFAAPRNRDDNAPIQDLYHEAIRLFETGTPIVAAVQGAAVGGGLGLALVADFRIAAPEARFSANFARLGFHHGFGLSVTLPALVGQQRAMELLYTGRRIKGKEAHAMGLCDELVPLDSLRSRARELASEIATSAPQAVKSIRATLRGDLAERIRAATAHERKEQDRLMATKDFREGVTAMTERRPPKFTGN